MREKNLFFFQTNSFSFSRYLSLILIIIFPFYLDFFKFLQIFSQSQYFFLFSPIFVWKKTISSFLMFLVFCSTKSGENYLFTLFSSKLSFFQVLKSPPLLWSRNIGPPPSKFVRRGQLLTPPASPVSTYDCETADNEEEVEGTQEIHYGRREPDALLKLSAEEKGWITKETALTNFSYFAADGIMLGSKASK